MNAGAVRVTVDVVTVYWFKLMLVQSVCVCATGCTVQELLFIVRRRCLRRGIAMLGNRTDRHEARVALWLMDCYSVWPCRCVSHGFFSNHFRENEAVVNIFGLATAYYDSFL